MKCTPCPKARVVERKGGAQLLSRTCNEVILSEAKDLGVDLMIIPDINVWGMTIFCQYITSVYPGDSSMTYSLHCIPILPWSLS